MGNVCWKEFRIGDLFNFVVGCQPNFKDRFLEKSAGMVPVITGVTSNNGVGFYTVLYGKKTYKDILTVSKDGEYAGTVFLQSEEVYLGGHSLGLIPKFVFNNRALLFVASAILKYQKCGFWKINNIPNVQLDKIKKIKIFLPAKLDGIPDWDYMAERIRELEAECIKELEAEHIKEFEAYLVATGLNDYELTEADKQVLAKMSTGGGNFDSAGCNESTVGLQWKKFRIGDLFEKLPVRKANKKDVRNFKNNQYCVPVVYAKFGDNGIMYWGLKDKFTTYSNVISIVYNGVISAGRVYAQEESTGILAESYFIRLKDGNVSFLVNQFLSCVIEKAIYSRYSRENLAIWNERVENDIISLPAKEDGTPDYDFMERYIRAIEKVTIADAVKWKDQQIVITKQIVDKGIA